ncbi:glycosyltransferase family 2 protein [Candidatus Margulisiibacteriota bacterium]
MNGIKLSILMTSYNYGHYLGEALEAICSQCHDNWEIIVIDDASTDNSLEIINQFRKKYTNLRLIKNEHNRGVLYSGSRILAEARGEYIYSAAADDKVLPGFFEKSMQLLSEYPEAGLCCSDSLLNYEGKTIKEELGLSKVPHFFPPVEVLQAYKKSTVTPIKTYTAIVKRSAINSAGGYLPELKWSCDLFAQNVIAFRYGFCYIPETLVMYRQHAAQYGAKQEGQWKQEKAVIKTMLGLIEDERYRDTKPFFKKSASLSISPWQAMLVVVKNKKYWGYLSSHLFSAAFTDLAKQKIKRFIPEKIWDNLKKLVKK